MSDIEKLKAWLEGELNKHNLTMAEASRRAGLNHGAISAILNGQAPGLKQCAALAEFFGVPLDNVLEMAGRARKPRLGEDPAFAHLADMYAKMDETRREEIVRIAESLLFIQKRDEREAQGKK